MCAEIYFKYPKIMFNMLNFDLKVLIQQEHSERQSIFYDIIVDNWNNYKNTRKEM